MAVRDQLGTEVLGGGTECVLSELRHDFRGKEFESFADMRGGAAEEPIVMRTCMGVFLSSGFLVCCGSLFGAERPFLVPSPAIRFAERAEGFKGPKR